MRAATRPGGQGYSGMSGNKILVREISGKTPTRINILEKIEALQKKNKQSLIP